MSDNQRYQVELVWNREHHYVPHGAPRTTLKEAIAYARELEEMGDGERVKKTHILDADGRVVWAAGRRVMRQT